MDQKKEKSKVWLILFFIFLIVMVFAAGMTFREYINYRSVNNQLDSLQSNVNNNTGRTVEEYTKEEEPEKKEEEPAADIENDTSEDSSKDRIDIGEEDEDTDVIDILEQSGIEIPDKTLNWDALHEENGDIYAWIYVPDTTVDYPVLQHPTDNSYYLNYNMDGTKGYPGCIYTENFNRKDFSDIHTVIYGHNLKDKTMFSSLHNFEDEGLFNEDHYIFIYTEDYVFVYRIFAAYEFDSLHLLDNFDYTNEYVYKDYLRKIYQTTDRVANVRADIQVTTEDKIVTLSTCTSDHDSNRRFLVTGVLINPRGQGR
ncbi:MAG: class B sortase [Lachnospiraceae bacterium]|nr:class B sortase [Lachnospiraceae bacterium]